MSRVREVARDIAPIVFAIMLIAAVVTMLVAIVLAIEETSRKPTMDNDQLPPGYEILWQGEEGVVYTFCNHGARVWVASHKNGPVSVDTQLGSGC